MLTVSDSNLTSLLSTGDGHTSDAKSAGEQSVGDLEESGRLLLDVGNELGIGGDIVKFVEHLFSLDLDVVKDQFAIVDTVETDLETHVFDGHVWHRFHVLVSDLNDEGVDSFIFAIHESLGEDNSIVSMTSAISDPVLVRHRCWTIDCELLRFLIEDSGGFHLRCVVTET